VHITINVVSLNPTHGEVYSIQHHVIKFVSDLRQVGGFLRVLQFLIPLLTSVIRQQYCTWHFYYLYFQRHKSWGFFCVQ
jgi:hypothetical protein